MNNIVAEIIPYGHENAITRAELATRLGESDRVIRAGINKSEELIINLQGGKGRFHRYIPYQSKQAQGTG